ncbi:MAG: histidine kinase N-terminal 7TM domain-containing protein [Anaerolineae bacterium]|jgi:hypothetical protein
MTISAILNFGNLILSSANVIIGFSLFAYILAHNVRSTVARAFCALIAFVSLVYVVDVAMMEVQTVRSAERWLRLQWLGIAFVPVAYFHFSDALLSTTGSDSRWRWMGVIAGYVIGLAVLILALFTDHIVHGTSQIAHIYHLVAGPYFWLFAIYYLATAISGWVNISRARNRCLTSTSRRRMSYLMLAILAPSAGVFPYLLIPTTARYFTPNWIMFLTLVGDIGIALMTIVIGYIVAYQGVLLPDRVIKHNLIHYLLRGPLVALLVILLMLLIPRVEQIWGLPRDTILIVTVAGAVVILELFINVAKPAIDRVIYRRDRSEIALIQTLDQRLLTTTDLEQLLENTLIALCDRLRAPSGFIVTMDGSSLSIRVFCGPREAAMAFLKTVSIPALLEELAESRRDEFISNDDFVCTDGHWLLPLRSRSDESTLGILGIRALRPLPEFNDDVLETTYGLVGRAELALEDMRLQQQVFSVLRGLGSELDRVQEWRSLPVYHNDPAGLRYLEANPIHSPGFVQSVRDALGQFWGGPKLSESPLLNMRIVHERLREHDDVPAKAIRAVLREAIERLRPEGERSMTATEWLMYNILDLKFVQGQRIRDITRCLAMSDSDFYRKQRIAIEQVAATLIQMEQAHAQSAAREAQLRPAQSTRQGAS